jgi:hypothetical protein
MRRLLLAAAAMAIALPAYAVTITGSYQISESEPDTAAGGGAQIVGLFGTGVSNTTTGTSGNFSLNLTSNGAYTTATNLASFTPYANCAGPDCSQPGTGYEQHPVAAGTDTDSNVKVKFTFTAPGPATNGVAGVVSDTATYTAKYSGTALTCAGGQPTGSNVESDCVVWATAGDPIVVDFANYVLDIQLNNATDWTITPQVQFALSNAVVQQEPVAEPAALAIMGVGILGLGYTRFRRLQRGAAFA